MAGCRPPWNSTSLDAWLPELGSEARGKHAENTAARAGAPMSGSDAADTCAPWGRGCGMMLAAAGATAMLLALWLMAAPGGARNAPDTLVRDAQCPALAVALMQLATLVVCFCGHVSPSSSGIARRRYSALLLLATVAGSQLPAAAAVSRQMDVAADEMVGDIATWVQRSQQEPSPPSSRHALDNQTYRKSDVVVEGFLPKRDAPAAEVLVQRAAARKLLQWPSGVSDVDRSPGPDPVFLKEEKHLKDVSKKMEAGLER